MSQNTSSAVMAQRVEPHDSLDFFPTPGWGTRALCEWLLERESIARQVAWEPACGADHMVKPLFEYFDEVIGTDVHDYGHESVHDFLQPFLPRIVEARPGPHWIITNPPFRLAEQFVHRALSVAQVGVAILVRTVFLEGGERQRVLFGPNPPTEILIFCERVPMLKGRVDRKASSATSYAWFVWRLDELGRAPHVHWVPAGTRKRLERDEDYAEAAA